MVTVSMVLSLEIPFVKLTSPLTQFLIHTCANLLTRFRSDFISTLCLASLFYLSLSFSLCLARLPTTTNCMRVCMCTVNNPNNNKKQNTIQITSSVRTTINPVPGLFVIVFRQRMVSLSALPSHQLTLEINPSSRIFFSVSLFWFLFGFLVCVFLLRY